MNTKRVLMLVVVLLLLPLMSQAEEKVRVKDIQENLSRYRNEVVLIEGFITQYIEASARTTARYYIKGDWGQVITVRTAAGSPVVGQRYEVKGVVDFDAAFNEPFLTEIKRTPVGSGVESTIPDQGEVKGVIDEIDKGVEEDAGKRTLIYVLAGAALLLVLILVVVLVALRRRSSAAAPYVTPVPGMDGGSHGLPEPERVVEGSTIKMNAPPPNTLKLLPGRLTVESGDDTVKEIRFYRLPDTEEMELTFGRSQGRTYNHVQLKPMTVSARQAKIVYRDDKHILVNYSKTNPTLVNGKIVEADQSVELQPGDRVEMGEVVFTFSK